MNPHSNHQNQALTILAIATAAIGFGLFAAEFRTGTVLFGTGPGSDLARTKLLCGGAALVSYTAVLVSVGGIIAQDDSVTGRQVAQWPMFLMALEMAFIALIFIVGVFENPAPTT
jgi:hypothetical protein